MSRAGRVGRGGGSGAHQLDAGGAPAVATIANSCRRCGRNIGCGSFARRECSGLLEFDGLDDTGMPGQVLEIGRAGVVGLQRAAERESRTAGRLLGSERGV